MATQTNVSMVSETSICNQALLWLGQKPIVSLNQASTTAVWMLNNYPFIRDAVLEMRAWTFATARTLSTTADLDPFGIQYRHPMPLGWLTVKRAYESVNGADPSDWITAPGWRVEGAYVLSNSSTVYLWGLERVVDTAKFTPLFVQALAARLAMDAALPLTENRQLQVDMASLFAAKLTDAAASDGLQGANDKITSNSFINARGAGRY